MKTIRPALAGLAVFALTAAAADPVFDEGFNLSLGTFALDTKTVMRVDGTTGSGDEDRQRSQATSQSLRAKHRAASVREHRMMWPVPARRA